MSRADIFTRLFLIVLSLSALSYDRTLLAFASFRLGAFQSDLADVHSPVPHKFRTLRTTNTSEGVTTIRTWTSSNGKKVEAELLRVDSDKVVLKRLDNAKEVEVPLGLLSKKDREFLEDNGHIESKSAEEDSEASASKSNTEKTLNEITTASQLENAARKCRFATTSLLLYQKFIYDPKIDSEEKKAAKTRLQYWNGMAKGRLVRIGTEWLPLEEAEKIHKEEADIVLNADKAVDGDDVSAAKTLLQKAIKVNPSSIRACFRLGIAEALHYSCLNSNEAEKHFTECLRRLKEYESDHTEIDKANLVATYNNLAIACVRQRKAGEALNYWTLAARNCKVFPQEIAHNISHLRAISKREGGQNTGRDSLYLTPSEMSRLLTLIESSSTVRDAFDPERAWRYMRLVSIQDKKQPDTVSSPFNNNSILVGSGSGVVVGPNFILTNRHVVEDSSEIKITAKNIDDSKPATVFAISSDEDLDLAILHVENLGLPEVALSTDELRLGLDVRALGFPEPSTFGKTIKVTSGTISSLPPLSDLAIPKLRNYLMHDAVLSGGNSGGPLCNQYCQIIGINTASMRSKIGSQYYFAVPSQQCITFLEKHKVPIAKPSMLNVKRPWEDAIAKLEPSCVQVLIYGVPDTRAIASRKLGEIDWDPYDDPWCFACYGRNMIECPERGCANGGVKSWRTDTIKFPNGDVHVKRTPIRVPCSRCRGKSFVPCVHCKKGFDQRYVSKAADAWLERFILQYDAARKLGLLD